MTPKERAELARLGMLAAADLDRSGHPYSGVMRRLAQVVAAGHDDEPGRCRCGAELPPAARGRPALYCSTRCRQAAHRATRRKRDEMPESGS